MSTEIATVPEIPVRATAPALANLRQAVMTLDAENMQIALSEFTERRNTFRRWLLSQLTEGVHYGFPPGCEPRAGVDVKQWKQKQSLYKAGAELLIELLGWRCEFEPDNDIWLQLGKPMSVCVRCRIVDGNGNPVGEGRGARQRGAKKMDDNGTIKMAEKCAKVNAVINALSLSDLFGQDLEDLAPNSHPQHNESAPKVQPRASRVDSVMLKKLVDQFKQQYPSATASEWQEFAETHSGHQFTKISNPTEWTVGLMDLVQVALSQELAEGMGDDRIPY